MAKKDRIINGWNVTNPETKIEKVLAHLIEKQTITSWEAITKYKATRLSAIIFNLRVHFNIKSVETRVGKSHFATYVYKGKKK